MTNTMAAHPQLEEGDLVFLAIPNPLFRRVASATGSKTSHVGIAFKAQDGSWIVAESTFPLSKFTPLRQYINRTEDGWYVVRRLKGGLSQEQIESLRKECQKRMSILYHLGFRYESPRLFCSKLVYDVYKTATGIQAGTLETFKQLLARQPSASLPFWRMWFFGFIPWSRLTVTPESQFSSELFETIYEPDLM